MRALKSLICAAALTLLFAPSYAAGYLTSVDGYRFDQGDAKLSPNGKYLALAIVNEGRRSLVVVETDGLNSVGGVNFGRWQDVGNFHWGTDERLVMEILHREEWDETPKFYGELYTAKYNGKHGELIYGWRAGEEQVGSRRKKKETIYGWAKLISLMPNDDEEILISSTEMPGGSELFEDRQKRDLVRGAQVSKLYSSVHRLNLKTRRMSSSYTRSPEPNTTYIAGNDDNLLYAFGGEPGTQVQMYRYVNDDWQKMNIGNGDSFMPVAFSADRTEMVYLDNSASQAGCLYRYNLMTQQKTQIYDHCDLEPEQLVLTIDQSNVYAVKTNDLESPYAIIERNSVEADFFAQIVDMFNGQKVDVYSRSNDGKFWIVRTQGVDDKLNFYLYSTSKNEFTQIL
ncbi:hypothetical protein [Aliiglaciecola litoralis]|uniref:WD40-like Beta Propeller Repeat n=1 Tax=Aliiglaciecola litoralis TaxID=582857 RepID=A0ABP3WT09_9ALTE